MLFRSNDTATTEIYTVEHTLSLHDALPISPRHLFYGLPLWAAAIGVAASRLPLVGVALVALIAVTSPASALRDPREIGFATATTDDAPAIHARENDLLLPYSTVFLARLSQVRDAVALPHGPGDEILLTLEHVEEPIGAVHIAIPTRPWTVVRVDGPFDKPSALVAAARKLHEFEHDPTLNEWFEWIEPGLCEAVASFDRHCP